MYQLGKRLAMTLEMDRQRLLEKLRYEIDDERVLEAMAKVRRELFVPLAERAYAYDDRPLPIGEGQARTDFLFAAWRAARTSAGEACCPWERDEKGCTMSGAGRHETSRPSGRCI
jgi:hypothetical protein